MYEHLIKRASIVIEALPYIRKFHGQIIVIKYGGSALEEKQLRKRVAEDIVLLKYVGMNPVVIHGGGSEITTWMEKYGLPTKFVDGLRVTDKATMEVVEMVLDGKVNSEIVMQINEQGGKGVGLSGKDDRLILAKPAKGAKRKKLGYVGAVQSVNAELVKDLISRSYIPVISTVGADSKGQTYNINADYAAGEISMALGAAKLIFLTDVMGVFAERGNSRSLIARLTTKEAKQLIRKKAIQGGMIPKVQYCIHTALHGVGSTHIINGKIPHALLLEIFTDHGIGTMVIP